MFEELINYFKKENPDWENFGTNGKVKMRSPHKQTHFIMFCLVMFSILCLFIGFKVGYSSCAVDVIKNNSTIKEQKGLVSQQEQIIKGLNDKIEELNDKIYILDYELFLLNPVSESDSIREVVEIQDNTEMPQPISDKETDGMAFRDRVYSTEQIEKMIIDTANRYGVDPILALRVAKCESYEGLYNTCHCDKGNPMNGSCVENCSKGIGIFKITQTTFDEAIERMARECKNTPGYIAGCELVEGNSSFKVRDNIEVAMFLMNKGELLRWKQSSSCWSSMVR